MPDAIKLTLSVDGADAAKKAVEGVTDAVETNTDAVRKAGAEAAASTARRRAAIAEVEAEMAAEKQAAAAKEESARAAAKEAEGMSVLEKQAKRAADQVERLALARGKSDEVAHAMGDATFERVRAGDQSPGRAVWTAKSGLAAEAQALKDIAAQSGPASEGMNKVGGTLAATTAKTNGLAAAGRLLLNAFLPDMLVSRVLAGGRALIGVLSGMSAAAIGLTGVLGAGLVAAFLAFRTALKESDEAGERLNRTIAEQNALQSEAASRGDMLHAILGPAYEEASRAAEEAERANERYVFSLERTADLIERVHDAESKRIALDARADKAAINSRYQPEIAKLRRDENALRTEESRVDSEYRKKLRAADSPEARRAIEGERDDKLAALRDRRAQVHEQLDATTARAEDERAAVERRQAEKEAAEAARHAAEKLGHAAQVLDASTKELDAKEEKRRLEESAKDTLENKFRSAPELAAHAGILNEKDPERRKELLENLKAQQGRRASRAGELDSQIEERDTPYLDTFVPFWAYARHDETRKLRAEREGMGNPQAAITLIENLLKLEQKLPALQKAAQDAANARDKAADKLDAAKSHAVETERTRSIVRSEAATAAEIGKLDAESRATESAVRAESRTQSGLDRKAYDSAAANLGAEASRQVASVAPELTADVDRFAAALGDGANQGEVANLRSALTRVVSILEKRHADSAGVADINARLSALESGQANLSGQVRAAR